MVKGSSRYTNTTIDNQELTIPAGGNLTTQSTGTSSIPLSHINLEAPHIHLNLPIKFDFGSNNTIVLLYDGLGNKLRKTVKTAGATTLTQDYLDGIELKNNTVEAVYNEEGRAFNNGGTFRYEFALRDHLGNTRVVFTDKNNSGSIDNTEILSETHYYPFGKSFDGAWYNDATAGKYRYLYNGKELSEEFDLNFYDYGARWLDPGMGSWWEVDPLAEKYYHDSPYVYAGNNPIRFIDPDGRMPVDVRTNEKGLAAIRNGLTANDAKYVQLDSRGMVDRSMLNSVSSESGNFNALKQLVNDDKIYDIKVTDQFAAKDGSGNLIKVNMGEVSYTDFITGQKLDQPEGKLGYTATPGTEGAINSPDSEVKVIINSGLNAVDQAKNVAHEAYGHGYLYSTGQPYQHKPENINGKFTDTNTALKTQIKERTNEAETNYKNQN